MSLICTDCGVRTATVRYTETRDGELHTLRLCEECARLRGAGAGLSSFAAPLVSILMGLLEDSLEAADGSRAPSAECPDCGLSFDAFRASGRLGCAGCYESFHDELESLLRRVHGSTVHVGRGSGGGEHRDRPRSRRLATLRAELSSAVRGEEYERAAELRDEIRSLESERRLEGRSSARSGAARRGELRDERAVRPRARAEERSPEGGGRGGTAARGEESDADGRETP